MMSKTRTNHEWLQELRDEGSAQEAAIADLRELLLKAALFYFSRNQGDFRALSRDEILQRAEDCAQDALIAVLGHLSDFRGDSKFSTWAYKFAINMALMAARRERWKGVSLDELSEAGEDAFVDWVVQDKAESEHPERTAMQDELVEVIRQVIEQGLTDKQKQVLSLMVFNEVPMDEVVRYMGTNRNAVYKLLHDARLKIKQGLQARDFNVNEAMALFGSMK